MDEDFKYIEGFDKRYKLYRDGRVVITATGKEKKCRVIGHNRSLILYDGEKYVGRTVSKLLETHFGHDFSGENEIADLEGEEWTVIPGFDDRYLISTHGRVKAVNVRYEGEKLMKPNLKKQKGELSISLSGVNKKVTTPISNLMGKVFLDNPHGHKMVIHLDGDKENNHVSNLKWVHNSEAQKTAIDLGLKPILWGEENASSVAVHQYTADGMRFIRRWGCMMDVERELRIHHNNISKVCLGKRNTAGGYHWRYEDEERDAESE